MARNRKNESGFLPGSVVMALPLLVVLMLSGLGYVWFKDQIDTLGDQVKKKEITLVELERQNRARRDQLAILCLPEALDKQVKSMNLGLGPPTQTQVVRLTETPWHGRAPAAAPAVQRQAQGMTRQRNN
jgi:ABC-type phosphate transport system auxiliary subunit